MKKNKNGKVLFVDDEKMNLSSIKRAFFKAPFQTFFVQSGEDALNFLENRKIDIIVSDIKMPFMNGIELLEIVKEKYPSIHRIVFSGYVEKNFISSALLKNVALSYFTKPFDLDFIRKEIEAILKIKTKLDNKDLFKIFNTDVLLYSVPKVFNELNVAIDNEESFAKITSIIENDLQITMKILSLANSAFYANSSLTNLNKAVITLGLDVIKAVVITLSISQNFNIEQKIVETYVKKFAFIKNNVKHFYPIKSKNPYKDVFSQYLLLMNVGYLISYKNYKNFYDKHIDLKKTSDRDIFNFESDLDEIEFFHTELGSILLYLYNLPSEFTDLALNHHDSDKLDSELKQLIEMYDFFDDLYVMILNKNDQVNDFANDWITEEELNDIYNDNNIS